MKQRTVNGQTLAVPYQRGGPTGPSKLLGANVYAVTPSKAVGAEVPTVAYRCRDCGQTHRHIWRGEGCYSALCPKPPPGYRFLLLRQPILFT